MLNWLTLKINNSKMRSFLKYIFTSVFLVITLAGCEKEYESIEEVDERKIQNYITAQKLNLTKDDSGIYYQVLNPGTGDAPKNSDQVFFSYTAKSVDGKEYFETGSYSLNSGFLGYVRPEGWRLALYKINRGGKVRVVFPSTLGFGRNGSGIIEGNEVLDSELELFDVRTQPELDDLIINRFIAANSLTGFTKLPKGVYYKIITPGTGTNEITLTSSITIAYTGRLLKGTVFDSATTAKPYTSKLENLIEGWKEAVPLIKKGGKIRILIPSGLAYGAQGSANIPANSVLDFDIEVTDVTNE
jgi:FKBP-type peptidyl-prolyl cis-trans isomerase FkpA